jgi:hypothetical protein
MMRVAPEPPPADDGAADTDAGGWPVLAQPGGDQAR